MVSHAVLCFMGMLDKNELDAPVANNCEYNFKPEHSDALNNFSSLLEHNADWSIFRTPFGLDIQKTKQKSKGTTTFDFYKFPKKYHHCIGILKNVGYDVTGDIVW